MFVLLIMVSTPDLSTIWLRVLHNTTCICKAMHVLLQSFTRGVHAFHLSSISIGSIRGMRRRVDGAEGKVALSKMAEGQRAGDG